MKNVKCNHRGIGKPGCDICDPRPRCVFCHKYGVHDCTGGEYTAPGIVQGTIYPGKVDAAATQGWRPTYSSDHTRWRITGIALDCPESVKRQLQERCDELNAKSDVKPERKGFEFL